MVFLFFREFSVVDFLTANSRGNQREKDRERSQARQGGKGKNKDDGMTPEQRRER